MIAADWDTVCGNSALPPGAGTPAAVHAGALVPSYQAALIAEVKPDPAIVTNPPSSVSTSSGIGGFGTVFGSRRPTTALLTTHLPVMVPTALPAAAELYAHPSATRTGRTNEKAPGRVT